MAGVKRTIVLITQDAQNDTLTIALSCGHTRTLTVARMALSQVYKSFHRKQRTGQRLRCLECEQEQTGGEGA